MIHTYQIEGLTLQTGDILCTMNGKPDILPGEFWRLVGRLVPGDVDHVVIYTGPAGRSVEAGSRGVITFDLPGAATCSTPSTASPPLSMASTSPRRMRPACGRPSLRTPSPRSASPTT